MSLLDTIIERPKRGTIAASDWLRTFKILVVRDVPTAFYPRKFQIQLVQAKTT